MEFEKRYIPIIYFYNTETSPIELQEYTTKDEAIEAVREKIRMLNELALVDEEIDKTASHFVIKEIYSIRY